MMDMKSRNQYLEELIRKNSGYHLADKKGKGRLLDEYCRTTGQNRKYVIDKLRKGKWVYQERRKKDGRQRIRKEYYDNDFVSVLIKCWEIFDRPCGTRLASLLGREADRLIRQGELSCSDEIVLKLKKASPRTIDAKLKKHKEEKNIKRNYDYKNNPLLYQKIPTRLSGEWDREGLGDIQMDFVEHCGTSNCGRFIHSLSTTDITTGWWEGGAQMGRTEQATIINMNKVKEKYPFPWREIHPDNDSAFINLELWKFAKRNKLKFSRSRPYHKNDNCFIEQKNSSHIRRSVGHLRYDTREELSILNDLYANELRLFKNFFQPVIKLISKERLGGHIKRKYDAPKTPYERLMQNPGVAKSKKEELQNIYEALNPAELKRQIDKKLKLLKQFHEAKTKKPMVEKINHLKINTVRFLNCTTNRISVR